jgi:hypothetical protein
VHDYGYDQDRAANRRTVGMIVGGIVLAVLIVVGLYFLGWFLKEQAVNRNTAINNDSTARQSALANEVTDLHAQITDLDVTLAGDLNASQKGAVLTNRAALVDNLCDRYGQMTGKVTISPNVHAFASKEC